MNGFCLRPFAEPDYPAVAAIEQAVYGDFATTENEQRRNDTNRPPEFRFARLVAEVDTNVVAAGEFDQRQGRYDPRKFVLALTVLPEYRNQGIGSALYDALSDALSPHNPLALYVYLREGNAPGIRFAKQRGFDEIRQIFPSELDVTTFDTGWVAAREARLVSEGICFCTYPDLTADPERDPKLHQLCEEIRADFPTEEPPTPTSYAKWREMTVDNPSFIPSAFQIAVDANGNYVGYNSVARDEQEPTRLWTQQTGVVRSHRRRGIATVLKARGAVWARNNGFTSILTTNDSANEAMLAVNNQFGFARQAAWLYFKKTFAEP